MCGIAGIIEPAGDRVQDLKNLLDALSHRGPDGRGVFNHDNISLGHVRLSIIDLTDKASQPMKYFHQGREYAITFNGEIYNYLELKKVLQGLGHVFTTTSDTEVVLAAYAEWGERCLAKFNGMFAFALVCLSDATVFFARDRLGVKPFYYHFNGKCLIFASEIKTFRKTDIPLKFKEECFWKYVLIPEYHFYGVDSCFYQEIKSLPAGCCMVYEQGRIDVHRWWNIQDFLVDKHQQTGEIPARLKALLGDAVGIRLRSDVEVALSLSGGMDSNAILAAIAAGNEPGRTLHTFTICHPGSPRDERELVRYTLSGFKQKLDIKPVFENFPTQITDDDVIDFCRTHDEPVRSFDVYNQYVLMKLVGSERIKVLLSGQGSDELFWGYPRYYQRLGISSLLKFDLDGLTQAWRYSHQHYHVSWTAFIKKLFSATFPKGYRLKKYSMVKRIAIGKLPNSEEYLGWLSALAPRDLNEYHRLELTETHLPSLLRDEDRNSMRFGVETRSPFLDRRLVELSLTLPHELNLSEGYTKLLLRKALSQDLPIEITQRKSKSGLYEKNTIGYVKHFESLALEVIGQSRFVTDRIKLADIPVHDKNVLWRLFNVAALDIV